MEPLLLKAGDVAKLLGLGRSKVFAMLAAGELPVIRIGRSVRVPRAALEGWIAEHTVHASVRSADAGPLFVGVEDRGGVPGAGPSPLVLGVVPRPCLWRAIGEDDRPCSTVGRVEQLEPGEPLTARETPCGETACLVHEYESHKRAVL
ncbi:MAG: helix-turn-helix domain-containing protein [Chloroflexi bacterium]|nr:MAG: helix-turn-helix domain-containing protein [Chloroflexota bacterium]